ncbi:MAG: hypothetical protein V1880_01780 [Patescibacteria group bacterium]
MYAILVSIALAIYTIILVDFGLLFQEISVNADMLTSSQALYTAEGVVENTFSLIGDGDIITRNIRFADEMQNSPDDLGKAYLSYNEGADSFYVQRGLSLSAEDLKASDAYVSSNRVVRSAAYLADGQTLDQTAYYGLEPRSAKGFAFREVKDGDNFNEIIFEYDASGETSGMLFEVFAFPREGANIDFLDFEKLKNDFDGPVQRIAINTKDTSKNGIAVPTGGQPMSISYGSYAGDYGRRIILSGFEPMNKNYLLHFQTLDNQQVHYMLSATYQGQRVMLPGMMQTIDIIGATPGGLYQRVKYQRQTEEELQPGLKFVHFGDQIINK